MYKKLSVSIAFAFLIVCIPIVASAQALADNAVVRASDSPKVFLISKGQKYWLRTAEILNSYRFAWRDVKVVSPEALSTYPDAQLISSNDGKKIYRIKGWTKRWVATPEAFNANGFNWNGIISTTALDFNHYEEGADITGKVSDAAGTTATIEIQALPIRSDVPQGVDFSPLWNVWRTVEEKARNSTTLDKQKMVEGAAEGVVRSLGDPYSVLFEKEESQKFSQDVAGEFGGIGAELGYKNGVVVIATLPGMPAEKVGLQAGDKIAAINGESTAGMAVDQAVARIRGTVGTVVKLVIERSGMSAPMEFSITRALIKVPTVSWSKKTNDIAYLRIHNFFGNVEGDFVQAVNEIKTGGMTKIVLDLRGNPGGLLNASINIAASFIPKDKLIVSADFGAGKQRSEFISPGGGMLENMQVVVLIDGASASAAEIVAGALRDSRGVTLVGETSFGKGTVQELIQLSGGTLLKLTTAQWIRPSGKPIDEHGIDPDIVVPMTLEEKASGRDPQLDKALILF